MLITDPDEAADFVKATKVDALAIAIGTFHGAYKFTRLMTGDGLAIDRIKAIHQRIAYTHLVMHGSSFVPQDWLAVINEFRGKFQKHTACQLTRFRKESNMGFARSRSIRIYVWRRVMSSGRI